MKMSLNVDLNDSKLDSDLSDIEINLDMINNDWDHSILMDEIVDYVNNNEDFDMNSCIDQELIVDSITSIFDENELEDIYEIIERDKSVSTSVSKPETSERSGGRKRKAKPIKNRGKCLRALFNKLKVKSKPNQSTQVDHGFHQIITRSQLKNNAKKDLQNVLKNTNRIKDIKIVLNKISLNQLKGKKSLDIKKDIELMYQSIDSGFKCIFCQFVCQSFQRSVIENHLKVKHWNCGVKEIRIDLLNRLRKRLAKNVVNTSHNLVNNNINHLKEAKTKSAKSLIHMKLENLKKESKTTAAVNRYLKSPSNRVYNYNGVQVIITRCGGSSIGPKITFGKVKTRTKSVTKGG